MKANAMREDRKSRTLPGWRVLLPALALAVLLTAGCGELTAGSFAETEVVVSGDADGPASGTGTSSASPEAAPVVSPVRDAVPDPLPDPSSAAVAPAGGTGETSDQQPIQVFMGTVTVTVELFMQSFEGEWIALTDGLRQATVDIGGAEKASLGSMSVDAGTYPNLRARFTSVRAEVEDGLPIVEAIVTVDFGDQAESLTVEAPLNLDLQGGDSVEILVDLNSAEWLSEAMAVRDAESADYVVDGDAFIDALGFGLP